MGGEVGAMFGAKGQGDMIFVKIIEIVRTDFGERWSPSCEPVCSSSPSNSRISTPGHINQRAQIAPQNTKKLEYFDDFLKGN